MINLVGNGSDVLRMVISALKISPGPDNQKKSKISMKVEIDRQLGVTQEAVSVQLKSIGMIQKQEN